MKRNQHGFSAPLLLVVLCAAGIVGVVGWMVYQNRQDKPATTNTATTAKTTTKSDSTPLKTGEIITLDPAVHVVLAADLAKLPPQTPPAFKAMLAEKIKINQPSEDCYVAYEVTRMSTVNIEGATGGVEKDTHEPGDNCGTGARIIWSLQPSGEWYEQGYQDIVGCPEIVSKKIYTEFYPNCYDEASATAVPNPVGSIKQLK